MYAHIWSITSFSHKCCPALYLGSKLTDHNIHHWSQIPEGNSHRGCTHLDLVAKQGWYAEGSSPEPHWKEGDSWGTIPEEESSGPGTQGVSSKRPHGCRCFISSVTTRNAKFCASPLLVWGCSPGTGCNLLEEASCETVHLLVGNSCFWSLVLSSCRLNTLTGQSVFTLSLWKMDVKAPAKF